MQSCTICGNTTGNKCHTSREMMFGFRHAFSYLECGNCGCVQLLEPPANLGDYYPKNYYSYQKHGRLMSLVRRRWAAYGCGANSLIGWFVTELFFPNNAIASVHRLNLPKTARIFELGSGSGRLLEDLAYFGYQNLLGADPFIAQDIFHKSGVAIHKKSYLEISGEFDLIMLHHAFEHMDHPRATLSALAKLLAPGGRMILRIPVASSAGWRKYNINWVHLDAPRHLFLHTFKSIDLLSAEAGLKITSLIHEAEEISIAGSESYLRDIPLHDPRYPLSSVRKRFFGWIGRRKTKAAVKEINRRGEADQICFYLQKAIN